LRSIDFIGDFCSRQIPLSPLVISKNLTKPFKSYDLEGFLIYTLTKLFSFSHFKGVQFGALQNFLKIGTHTRVNPFKNKQFKK